MKGYYFKLEDNGLVEKKDDQLVFNREELERFVQQELDKAREEGIKEYIDLLQGIEHYEGLKMVRGLVGLDKHEKRDYYNLQRRFEELSKLNNK
jgi:hypothetical protein